MDATATTNPITPEMPVKVWAEVYDGKTDPNTYATFVNFHWAEKHLNTLVDSGTYKTVFIADGENTYVASGRREHLTSDGEVLQ